MHALPLLTYISFPKCPPFIFRFSSTLYDQCRMFLLIMLHTCGPYYFLLCYTLWAIIEHPCLNTWYPFINCLAYCYSFEEMNHLTLCSSNNHLWYPFLVMNCKVHVSFITVILEDEYWLSLGMLMHVKCIDDLCN